MNRGKSLKTIRHAIEYLGVLAFYALVRLTPHSQRFRLATLLATLGRWATPSRVRVATTNLKLVFSESTPEEISQVVKGVYRNLALNALDLIDPYWALRRVEVPPHTRCRVEEIQTILAQGRPVIIATGHLGGWETLGQVAGREFRGCVFLALEQSNKRVNRFLNNLRLTGAATIIQSHEAGRALPKAFKQGLPVYMVADQDGGKDGTVVDLMGVPASYHRGVATFALHYNAPIAVLFLVREGKRLLLQVPDIIEPNASADRETEIIRLMSAYSDRLGSAIFAHPDQWLWTHRRWKSTVGKY